MPKIQWTGLPPALRDHLFERLRERKITADDLYQLKAWRESEPEAPDGAWYKDLDPPIPQARPALPAAAVSCRRAVVYVRRSRFL